MMVNISGTSETKYYYHANNLYSVAALTDQAGAVVERYSYTAYGKPTFHNPTTGVPLSPQPTGSALGNPYLYTGRRLDAETGLYYYRARYYDPDLGRFLGRDPIGYEGGINLYEYVGDRPLVKTDPSGHLGWACKASLLSLTIACHSAYGLCTAAPCPGPQQGGVSVGCAAGIATSASLAVVASLACGNDPEAQQAIADAMAKLKDLEKKVIDPFIPKGGAEPPCSTPFGCNETPDDIPPGQPNRPNPYPDDPCPCEG
jgi:RHS repeat-associated protein